MSRGRAAGPEPDPVRCPACGTASSVNRDEDPGIGALSMDELEALARSEWRRSLGQEAYRRPHRRRFVRSLLTFALAPESPIRRSVLDDALWDEIAALEVWGLNRREAEVELHRLTRALWSVLARTGIPEARRRELVRRMDDWLRAELEWPEEEWEAVRALDAPLV